MWKHFDSLKTFGDTIVNTLFKIGKKLWVKRALNKKVRFLAYLFAPFLLFLIVFLLLNIIFPLPSFTTKKKFVQVVVDENEIPLRYFPDQRGIWRYPVSLTNVSQDYLQMLLSYEDRWFYYHPGVNPVAILRAFFQNLSNSKVVSGGSTLTMQVARLIDPHRRTYPGKIKQIFRALQLEWKYSKDEILNFYLNYAPFGGSLEGVLTATHFYFNKSAKSLTLAEAALLTVIPQLPSILRPDRNLNNAVLAKNKVLKRVKSLNIWKNNDIEEAMKEPIVVEKRVNKFYAPHLSEKLTKIYPQDEIIRTSINYKYQVKIENIVKEYLGDYPKEISAAVLLINHSNFLVKAYVGSADYTSFAKKGYVDMVKAVRSPGSTLKPFLYGLAIEEGLIHSQSLLSDVPQRIGDYEPLNFSKNFSGPVSASSALMQSLNIPAVQVLKAYGPYNFYTALENVGMDLKLISGGRPNLSFILGGEGISLFNLVGGFASFGNLGVAGHPRFISTEKQFKRRLLSPGSAWIINNILSKKPLHPHSWHFKKNYSKVAWKTGTSYGLRDSWILANTPIHTIGLWVGRADGNYVLGNFSGQMALPLIRKILPVIYQKSAKIQPKPRTVTTETICWPSGNLKKYEVLDNCHIVRKAYLYDQMVPKTLPDSHQHHWATQEKTIYFSKKSKLRVPPNCNKVDFSKIFKKKLSFWPIILEPWIQDKWKARNLVPPLDKRCQHLAHISDFNFNKLKIINLHHNNIIRPVFGDNKIVLNLKVVGAKGEAHWFLNNRWFKSIKNDKNVKIVLKESGTFKILVTDDSGEYTEKIVKVIIQPPFN